MLNIINLSSKKPKLQQITIIKQVLPLLNQNIVIIGHSSQSLKSLQFIFQIYQYQTQQVKTIGRIDAFGVRFLTDYVAFKQDGKYMNLISSTGQKIIRVYDFYNGTTQNHIKSIQTKSFQINPKRQYYNLHYMPKSDRIILVQGLSFTEQYQIIVRIFNNQNKVNQYRIVNLDMDIPRVLLHDQTFSLLSNSGDLSIYQSILQAKYYFLQNIQSLTILCLHHQLIVSFKQSKSVFMLTTDGALKSVVEDDVINLASAQNYLYFLVSRQQKQFLQVYKYKDGVFIKQMCQQLQQLGYKIVSCNNNQVIIEKS